jgi:hypothetical protein
MTDDDYRKMYNGLKKKQLIEMLIENQKIVRLLLSNHNYDDTSQPVIHHVNVDDKVPYNTICECNPKNGGSGICGCTMANMMVDRSPITNIPYYTTTSTFVARNEDC